MSRTDPFQIDLNAEFPHLPHAPIVEAVLHLQAAAGKTLDKTRVHAELKRRFRNYDCQEQQEIGATFQLSPEGSERRQRTRWDGFRLTGRGEAKGYLAQFKPNGVLFSRLAPYENWSTLLAAGLPFWEAYLELAGPPVMERFGVRFINQILLGTDREAAAYLNEFPAPPRGIGLSSDLFFHQDTFRLSEHPYQINWVRTVQPTPENVRMLIVDIDVFSDRIKSLEREVLLRHLTEMRFLKNKLFFTCMTQQALEEFGKDDHE